MSPHPQAIQVVTVFNEPEKAKEIIAALMKDLKTEFYFVHVANCQAISGVKPILSSLVAAPQVLISAGHWFDEEQEEIREIAQRLVPDIKLIMIPFDLTTKDEAVLEYLKEQVTESRLPRV